MKVAKIYSIKELAMMVGWSRKRLARNLLKMNQERGGQLLKNIGTKHRPRWTVTLDSLRQAAPQWFRDDDTIEARLDDLEEARMTDAAVMKAAARRVAELSAEVESLRVRSDLLQQNLRNVLRARKAAA